MRFFWTKLLSLLSGDCSYGGEAAGGSGEPESCASLTSTPKLAEAEVTSICFSDKQQTH